MHIQLNLIGVSPLFTGIPFFKEFQPGKSFKNFKFPSPSAPQSAAAAFHNSGTTQWSEGGPFFGAAAAADRIAKALSN